METREKKGRGPGKKLVYGIGINDSTTATQLEIKEVDPLTGKINRKVVWKCPFYSKWVDMIRRCYSYEMEDKFPSYESCVVCPEWITFSNFRSWMCQQDWEGKALDKDLLFPGNKIYSPDTCLFVDQKINNFITESNKRRGDWPIGVHFDKSTGKFKASISMKSEDKKKCKMLGRYDTPELAHDAWLAAKIEKAKLLADSITDEKIRNALISYYQNYKEVK